MKRSSSIILPTAILATGLLATSVFASKYTDTITSKNPLEYWTFNEAAGSTVAQSISSGANAYDAMRYINWAQSATTVKSAIPGIDDLAAAVGGPASPNVTLRSGLYETGLVPLPKLATLNNPANWTVEMWLKPSGAFGAYVNFAGSATGGDAESCMLSFQGSQVQFGLGGTTALSTLAANGITAGQWNFVALTFAEDQASNTSGWLRYYVNGIELSNEHYTGLPDITTAGSRGTWQFFDPGTSQYVGVIDELAIFDTTLTSSDLMDQFNAVPEPGLLSLLALGGAFLVWRRKIVAKRA